MRWHIGLLPRCLFVVRSRTTVNRLKESYVSRAARRTLGGVSWHSPMAVIGHKRPETSRHQIDCKTNILFLGNVTHAIMTSADVIPISQSLIIYDSIFYASMKRDLLLLYGISLVVFVLTLFGSLEMGRTVWSSSQDPSAVDMAIIVFVISIAVPSMIAMAINYFILLGQKKDWRDFWSDGMLEYFSKHDVTEKWRVARGRYILFTATLLSGFFVIWIYAQIRG